MGNTTKQITARARARAASSRFYEMEKQREAVMGRYFDAIDAVDKVYEVRERAIAKATEQAEVAAADAQASADEAIRELLALGVTRAEVPVRLGCSVADVRRAVSISEQTEPAAAGTAGADRDGQGADAEVAPAIEDHAGTVGERAGAEAFAMQS